MLSSCSVWLGKKLTHLRAQSVRYAGSKYQENIIMKVFSSSDITRGCDVSLKVSESHQWTDFYQTKSHLMSRQKIAQLLVETSFPLNNIVFVCARQGGEFSWKKKGMKYGLSFPLRVFENFPRVGQNIWPVQKAILFYIYRIYFKMFVVLVDREMLLALLYSKFKIMYFKSKKKMIVTVRGRWFNAVLSFNSIRFHSSFIPM